MFNILKSKFAVIALAILMIIAGGWYFLGQSAAASASGFDTKLTVVIEEVNDATDQVTAVYAANISGAGQSPLEMLTAFGSGSIRSSEFQTLQASAGEGWGGGPSTSDTGGTGTSGTSSGLLSGIRAGSHYHVYIRAFVTAYVTNDEYFVLGPQKYNSGITDRVYDDWVHVEGKVGSAVPSHSNTWQTLKTQPEKYYDNTIGGVSTVGWHPGFKDGVQVKADQYATTGTYFDQYQDANGWHAIKGDILNGMQFRVTALAFVKANTGEVVQSGAATYVLTLNVLSYATMLSLNQVGGASNDA